MLTTEAAMTEVAAQIDRTRYVPAKTTTTVALDFGCISIDDEIKLYLFGTPGQDRFGFMWAELTEGAMGALVIVDTRRLDDCYAAVDYFEQTNVPFVVAINLFDGQLVHDLDNVRWALAIDDGTPLVTSTPEPASRSGTPSSRCCTAHCPPLAPLTQRSTCGDPVDRFR